MQLKKVNFIMFEDNDADEILAKINYVMSIILGGILVVFLVLFYYYVYKVFGTIHLKSYLDFVQLIIMPAIVVLPYVAGIISIVKAAEIEELKDGILALLSGVLFICAEILSIIVLAETARSVIDYVPAKFDFFYKLNFLFYPLENSNVKAISIMLLIFVGGILSGTSNITAIICAGLSLSLNVFFIIGLHNGSGYSSENEQNAVINLLVYGNIGLSLLSCLFSCIIEPK